MNQKEKSRQTADYIINCGIDEFAKNGGLVSLNDICKNHNISKGKLYHHFSSKEDLLCVCVCYVLDKLSDDIYGFEININLTVAENLHNFFMGRIEYWIENPNYLTLLRLAYSLNNIIFGEESQNKIALHKNKWTVNRKKQFIYMLENCGKELKINSEHIAEIFSIMYEYTFQDLERKLTESAAKGNPDEICKCSKQLIEYHDMTVSLILYGALKTDE